MPGLGTACAPPAPRPVPPRRSAPRRRRQVALGNSAELPPARRGLARQRRPAAGRGHTPIPGSRWRDKRGRILEDTQTRTSRGAQISLHTHADISKHTNTHTHTHSCMGTHRCAHKIPIQSYADIHTHRSTSPPKYFLHFTGGFFLFCLFVCFFK